MSVVRHLVLDNAAATALLSKDKCNTARREAILAIDAANGTRFVPTAVRAEAGWDRSAPAAADANRLLPSSTDATLDAVAADRAVTLRAQVPSASVVDASVAVAAERAGAAGGVVEVLTSDEPGLEALSAYLAAEVSARKL